MCDHSLSGQCGVDEEEETRIHLLDLAQEVNNGLFGELLNEQCAEEHILVIGVVELLNDWSEQINLSRHKRYVFGLDNLPKQCMAYCVTLSRRITIGMTPPYYVADNDRLEIPLIAFVVDEFGHIIGVVV